MGDICELKKTYFRICSQGMLDKDFDSRIVKVFTRDSVALSSPAFLIKVLTALVDTYCVKSHGDKTMLGVWIFCPWQLILQIEHTNYGMQLIGSKFAIR